MTPMTRRWLGAALLLLTIVGVGAGLAAWKYATLQAALAAAANQPEPVESVTAAVAETREFQQTTVSIGTIMALRSITLQNELPGTVREVRLSPGEIVAAGTLLIGFDVSVEEAELKAQEAHAALTRATLERMQNLWRTHAVAKEELDRARAEHEVALAEIERIKAVLARKTIRAPFRARIGIADVHPGQYLDSGTVLTTLQGVDDAVHVDFEAPQTVAAALREGDAVEVFTPGAIEPVIAHVIAVDARADPATRNTTVRAKMESAAAPAPGASVRVRAPVGPKIMAVAIPANALRRGPAGDHVFALEDEGGGRYRARLRPVQTGPLLGDLVLILSGLAAGEQVAASGSFKLNEGTLVAITADAGLRGIESE
jgi:membrane fusion protein (multidrug efflux system)